MDRLESLGNQLSQITMYDIKSMYNQVRLRPRTCACRAVADARLSAHEGEEHGAEPERDGDEGAGGDERRRLVRCCVICGTVANVLTST